MVRDLIVFVVQVEHVIKERNMLDAFVTMESYCNLLIERVHLIEQHKLVSYIHLQIYEGSFFIYLSEFSSVGLIFFFGCRECPTELREAISTLLFAASRCGEFPELQEIRALFTSRYGKEFVNRAIELRNNCGVNARVWFFISIFKCKLGMYVV